jgi:hypothetical protein
MAKGDGSARRIALVVGNSAYDYVGRLNNPENDAAAMASVLRDLAFDEIISAINLGQKDLLSKLQEFYGKLDRQSTALLFYAGHGVQVWGQNYLLPRDAQVAKASLLRSTALPLNDVVRGMSRRANTRLLILDACRNDPLSNQAGWQERGARSAEAIGSDFDDVGRGLAEVTATAGTFVAYATEPGNVALDGVGQNSPFTTALAKHIALPGLSVDDIMMQVRVDVLDATKGKQLPWSVSALTRQFQFKEGSAQSGSRDFEQEYWDRVKDTDNPDFLESFLRQFPNGRHAEAARALIGGVRARKEAADWEAARSVDTIAALADFARRYPQSKNAAVAKSRLFVKQLRQGATFAVAGIVGAIAVSSLFVALLAAAFRFGLKLEVPVVLATLSSLLLVIAPSIVFGALLWVGLKRYASRPFLRAGLVLCAIAAPAIAVQAGPLLLSHWSPKSQSTLSYLEKTRELEVAVAVGMRDDRYKNDPVFKNEIDQQQRALKQARTATYPARVYYPLLTAVLAGLSAGCALLVTGIAISGLRGLAPWETATVGGALFGSNAAMAMILATVDDPQWRVDETIALACWGSIALFAALGTSRAAAVDRDSSTIQLGQQSTEVRT